MQEQKRTAGHGRRSASIKSAASARSRTSSVTSQRGKADRSRSLQSVGQRGETKGTGARAAAAGSPTAPAVGAARKPVATLREQLPTVVHPTTLLPQRAALRGASAKVNCSHILELLKLIRLSYTSWSSDGPGSGAASARTRGPFSLSTTTPSQMIVEGRSASAAGSGDDGAKPARPSQEAAAELVLPIQQLEAIVFPGMMDLPAAAVSRHNTKGASTKYWKVLLQKSNSTIPLLMAAARSGIVGISALAAEELLVLLYNILKNTPPEKQRRLVRLSDKLGLMNVCGTVLRTFAKSSSQDESQSARAACEAVGLLLALSETYNSKVAVVARISRMLSGLLETFTGTAKAFVVALSLERCDAIRRRREEDAAEGQPHARLLADCDEWRRATIVQSTGTLHLLLALFSLSKSTANAAELGPRCVAGAAMIVEHVAYALDQITPLIPAGSVGAAGSSTCDAPAVVAPGLDVPTWLTRWLGHLQLIAFWGLVLLQRLCTHPSTRRGYVKEAGNHHLLRSLQRLVHVGAAESVLVKRFELLQAALMTMSVTLRDDRTEKLSELDPVGGLPAVVHDVLTLSSTTPVHWLQLYACLCDVYGVTALPTKAGRDANTMDKRLPAALVQAATATAGHRPKPEKPVAAREAGSEVEKTATQNLCPEEASGTTNDECRSSCPGAPEGVASALPVDEARLSGTGLLPVDEHPDLFSPELAGGEVAPVTALPAATEVSMPWQFTDTPPPDTVAHYFRSFTACGQSADLSPLSPPSEEQRVRVLKHLIARLGNLDAAAHDEHEQASARHAYSVVYERGEEGCNEPREESTGTTAPPIGDAADSIHCADLCFASNYESGNLQRAIKVSENEYDLVLSWDTATNSYTQWFCFSITNYHPGATYRFNIVNMEKNDSTFNEGQRPLLLHVPSPSIAKTAAGDRVDWKRTGHEILYFKGPYTRHTRDHLIQTPASSGGGAAAKKAAPTKKAGEKSSGKSKSGGGARKARKPGAASTATKKSAKGSSSSSSAPPKKRQTYYTASFCVTMPEAAGTVYLCNCFPFTYTELRHHIAQLEAACQTNGVSLMVQSLCVTPGGLPVPLLTATSLCDSSTGARLTAAALHEKPVVVLDARVHPGETNGSWVMQGILDFLLAPPTDAMRVVSSRLLDTFVFKIIPMLNVDGVAMGNHRCSIPGFDLNRDYLHPDPQLNPAVYSMKRLIQHMTEVEHRKVVLYGDFHGHSKAKNFLLYGCTRRTIDVLRPKKSSKKDCKPEACAVAADAFAPEKLLPSLLSQMCPTFRIEQSNFGVLRSKRGTARISIYKEYGVRMSLGVEGTMMGGRGANYTVQDAMSLKEDGTIALNWCGAAADAFSVETHYNQDTYRTFGAMFLLALDCLVQCEAHTATQIRALSSPAASNSAASGTDTAASCAAEDVGVQWAWAQAQSTGSTREPPRVLSAPPSHAPDSPLTSGAVVVAGPYALATRSERRDGEATTLPNNSPLATATMPLPVPLFPSLSLEEKAQALHDLLRSEQLGLKDADETDDAADEDTAADDVEDDNSEGGDMTGDAEATVDAAASGMSCPVVVSHWGANGDKSSSSSSASSEAGVDEEDVLDDEGDDENDDADDTTAEEEEVDNDFMGSAVIPADILSL